MTKINNQKIVFSGIQPTGDLNIGHYLGAIKSWISLQEQYNCLYCVVDLHALTIPENIKNKLPYQTYKLIALYLALGLNPDKIHIFLQSENPNHTYLYWILECFTPFGQLKRMTQFKEKSAELKNIVSGGLFDYPVLMASDILLYNTDLVPVGQDQKQHVELTRDIAENFNKFYKTNCFKIPEPLIPHTGAKIKDLQNPQKKMSKSCNNDKGIIFITDTKTAIEHKISQAVTDSDGTIIFDPVSKPGISNLIQIYSGFSGLSIKHIEQKYEHTTYDVFKKELALIIWNFLAPIQQKYAEYNKNTQYINKILDRGLEYSLSLSNNKITQIKTIIGLNRLK